MALSRNIKEQKQKLENPTAESEGIKITILKPGDAVNFPKIGDSISVHYICFLDNETMVDNSYLRGQPALFVLGSNQVIRGWEEVLLSGAISKGEKARLVIPSEVSALKLK
jgi:FK506-binding protein 1